MILRGGFRNDKGTLFKTLRRVAQRFPARIGSALLAEANIEMTEAKKRTPVSPIPAPKDVVPGTLRASGQVDLEIEGNKVSALLSFGGAAADYVIPQHENLDYHHTTGQAKFLESVLDESRPYMAGRLARRLDLRKMKV